MMSSVMTSPKSGQKMCLQSKNSYMYCVMFLAIGTNLESEKLRGGGGRLNLLKLSIRLLFYPGKYTRYTDVCVIYRTAHLVMLASSSFNNS